MWYQNIGSMFFRFVTKHACDACGGTDRENYNLQYSASTATSRGTKCTNSHVNTLTMNTAILLRFSLCDCLNFYLSTLYSVRILLIIPYFKTCFGALFGQEEELTENKLITL